MVIIMDIVLFCLLLATSLRGVAYAQVCSETDFKLDDKKFNVNHLKNHKPPTQLYSDKSNLYAKKDDKTFVFFNIMDLVYKQKVDNHQIEDNLCQPRSQKEQRATNRPVACVPETNDPKKYCPNKKSCWVALGSCNNVTTSYIDKDKKDAGIILLYEGGDDLTTKFLVEIQCCITDECIKADPGIPKPLTLQTENCKLDATHCVKFSSPYGCDCDKRASLDTKLGKKEFHCDATPKGLYGGASTGTWLVIIFSAGVILYLGIGIGYNYTEGRRGVETIPHLEMWQDLGGLIYDGFRYVISCGEYREGVQYDAIG